MAQRPLSVGVIVGSLRQDSLTKRVARELIAAAPPRLRPRFVEIRDLPLYNEDLDVEVAAEPPAAWARFRAEIRACEAVLFVTPEYNRSVPAPLKNAIDVGSAPHGQNVFRGLPAAIVSASPGRMGAFGANHHLRQSLVFLDMPTMQQPELYIGGSDGLLDENGALSDPSMASRLTTYMERFAAWAACNARMAA